MKNILNTVKKEKKKYMVKSIGIGTLVNSRTMKTFDCGHTGRQMWAKEGRVMCGRCYRISDKTKLFAEMDKK